MRGAWRHWRGQDRRQLRRVHLAGIKAEQAGFAQCCGWTAEQKYIEEVAAMNIFFVYGDTLYAQTQRQHPARHHRDSVIKLAAHGLQTGSPQDAEQVIRDIQSGAITEALARHGGGNIARHLCYKAPPTVGDGGIGAVSQRLYDTLTGIQWGRDSILWMGDEAFLRNSSQYGQASARLTSGRGLLILKNK